MKFGARKYMFRLGLYALMIFALTARNSFAWTVKGTVYGGNVPLSGATVTAYDASTGNTVGSSVASDTGSYTVSVGNGRYDLLVTPPTQSGLPIASVHGIIVDEADFIQNITLVPVGTVLGGVVRSPDGTGIVNVRIKIMEEATGAVVGDLYTDATGSYSIPVTQVSIR